MAARSKHHAAIRDELLAEGHRILETQGYQALSMRQLAQNVGISSGAPYHHFPDRRTLLLALALDGFCRLNQLGRSIVVNLNDQPERALAELGANFLKFADTNPRMFELMYESELVKPVDPLLAALYHDGFDLLLGALRQCHPELDSVRLTSVTVSYWSTLFGFAQLMRHGLLEPFAGDGDQRDRWRAEVIEVVTDRILL